MEDDVSTTAAALRVVADPGTHGVAALARLAEDVGFEGLYLGETSHDPLVLLGVASQVTTTLQLGTSIYVALARTPMVTAIAANDVQTLAQGRLTLGLGSQVQAHITRRFAMPWSRPAARMREYVQALHAIWDAWQHGTALRFEGEFYQHTLMAPMFDPGPNVYGRPPVFLAGVGPGMARIAGEIADGLLVHSFVTEQYLREVLMPSVQAGIAAAGRDPRTFTVTVTPMLAAGTGAAEVSAARERVRSQIAFYGSTPAYRSVLDLHGWSGLHEKLYPLSRAQDWAAMAALVTDEMVDAFGVSGEIEPAVAELQRRWGSVADVISVAAGTTGSVGDWRPVFGAHSPA